MRPGEMQRHGTALAERVREEVDTALRLDLLLRQRNRSRLVAMAAAAAVIVAALVGSLWFTAVERPPVVTEPPPTPPSSLDPQSLPVEVYLVLLGDYRADTATGECGGDGPLAEIRAGSSVEVKSTSPTQPAVSVFLPGGEEIGDDDQRAAFLLPEGATAGCVFVLPDLGLELEAYEESSLLPKSDPDAPSGMTLDGDRVVYWYGEIPLDPDFETPKGVISDDPEVWQAELRSLRASAAPGRIVGFVSLSGANSSGAPTSPRQPVCVGAGDFADVTPGASIVVVDAAGIAVAEGILRGSAYDGPLGCSMWFGLDVPGDLETYTIVVAAHPAVTFDRATLDEFGWLVNLWSDPATMQANCLELEPEATPMTCVLLEPSP